MSATVDRYPFFVVPLSIRSGDETLRHRWTRCSHRYPKTFHLAKNLVRNLSRPALIDFSGELLTLYIEVISNFLCSALKSHWLNITLQTKNPFCWRSTLRPAEDSPGRRRSARVNGSLVFRQRWLAFWTVRGLLQHSFRKYAYIAIRIKTDRSCKLQGWNQRPWITLWFLRPMHMDCHKVYTKHNFWSGVKNFTVPLDFSHTSRPWFLLPNRKTVRLLLAVPLKAFNARYNGPLNQRPTTKNSSPFHAKWKPHIKKWIYRVILTILNSVVCLTVL